MQGCSVRHPTTKASDVYGKLAPAWRAHATAVIVVAHDWCAASTQAERVKGTGASTCSANRGGVHLAPGRFVHLVLRGFFEALHASHSPQRAWRFPVLWCRNGPLLTTGVPGAALPPLGCSSLWDSSRNINQKRTGSCAGGPGLSALKMIQELLPECILPVGKNCEAFKNRALKKRFARKPSN